MTAPLLGPDGRPAPGQQLGIPMGIQLVGAMDDVSGITIESRRDRFVLAAMAAFAGRESSTLANAGMLGRLAVNLADATLATMVDRPAATATPAGAPPAGEAG